MTPDFAFCIPLIGQDKAIDWQRVLDNLQATLQSMLNQQDPNFVVYIATNDSIELLETQDPRILMVSIANSKLPPFHHLDYEQSNNDAGVKRHHLTQRAYDDGIKHVMYCDADDLVSDTIVKFVRETRHPIGYVIRCGLVFDCASGKYLPCPSASIAFDGFDRFCGSSIILSLSEDLRKIRDWPFDVLYFGHNRIRGELLKQSLPLMDVNHPSVIYVINSGENISLYDSNDQDRSRFMKQVIIRIQHYGVPLNANLMREFGLAQA